MFLTHCKRWGFPRGSQCFAKMFWMVAYAGCSGCVPTIMPKKKKHCQESTISRSLEMTGALKGFQVWTFHQCIHCMFSSACNLSGETYKWHFCWNYETWHVHTRNCEACFAVFDAYIDIMRMTKIQLHLTFLRDVFNKQRKKQKRLQKLNSTSAGNILLMFRSLSPSHTHMRTHTHTNTLRIHLFHSCIFKQQCNLTFCNQRVNEFRVWISSKQPWLIWHKNTLRGIMGKLEMS